MGVGRVSYPYDLCQMYFSLCAATLLTSVTHSLLYSSTVAYHDAGAWTFFCFLCRFPHWCFFVRIHNQQRVLCECLFSVNACVFAVCILFTNSLFVLTH